MMSFLGCMTMFHCCAFDLLLCQIWEEDLVGFEDLWTVPLGTTGAADEEEEDSNAGSEMDIQ